jgi:hypothetical protein
MMTSVALGASHHVALLYRIRSATWGRLIGVTPLGGTVAATVHLQFVYSGCYSINLIQGR